MQIWHEELPFNVPDEIIWKQFPEHALFFDIETTGFSASHTLTYLIGCVSRKGRTLIINQFFADLPTDEVEIITSFLSFAERFDTLVTFNGIGFDIPYLSARCRILNIPEHLADYSFVDIYKLVSKLKFLLQLPDCKQPSVEHFLGIQRTDTFHGRDLIDVYQKYIQTPSKNALAILKQHNFDDICAMPRLLHIYSYIRLLEGGFTIFSARTDTYTDLQGRCDNPELFLTLHNEVSIPTRVSCRYEGCYLTSFGEKTELNIKLLDGELKYFFEQYKDYYYLPSEDVAIHKSVAAYVEKEHRKRASAATCYTRKTAIFVPQYEHIVSPLFRKEHKDKLTYFELTDSFLNSDSLLYAYVLHLLKVMSGGSFSY